MNKYLWLICDPDTGTAECVATTLVHAKLYLERLGDPYAPYTIQKWALTKDRTRYHCKDHRDIPARAERKP